MVDQKVNVCDISGHIVGLPCLFKLFLFFLFFDLLSRLPPLKETKQVFGLLSKTLLERIHVRAAVTSFGGSLGGGVRMFSGRGNSL